METELKFLVKGIAWKDGLIGKEIKQGFISTHPQRVVRVRICEEKAYLTIKGERIGISNPEFEWAIPCAEAEVMFNTPHLMEGHIIHKLRYRIESDAISWKGKALVWDVDEFLGENAPMRIAEIELPQGLSSEEESMLMQNIFDLRPAWVGDYLDFEKDPAVSRYFNSNLSQRPFSLWSEKERSQVLHSIIKE